MKTQKFPVSDKILPENIQRNFEDLYHDAHTHDTRTDAPSDREGSVGDIVPVLLNNTPYLYIKFPTVGWKRILAS